MRLKPADDWRYFFDTEYDRMMLDLADGYLFRSRFSRRMLAPDAFSETLFCVDDVAQFFIFEEQSGSCDLTENQQAELVLNGLIARRFLKPMMPKSWYFSSVSQSDWVPDEAEIVGVKLRHSGDIAHFLVIECGENAALCLLAQPKLDLNGRIMALGDAIKIMHDRLFPLACDEVPGLEQAV